MTNTENIEMLKDYLTRALERAQDDYGVNFTLAEQRKALRELANEL